MRNKSARFNYIYFISIWLNERRSCACCRQFLRFNWSKCYATPSPPDTSEHTTFQPPIGRFCRTNVPLRYFFFGLKGQHFLCWIQTWRCLWKEQQICLSFRDESVLENELLDKSIITKSRNNIDTICVALQRHTHTCVGCKLKPYRDRFLFTAKNEGDCTYAMHRICEHRVHGVQKSLIQIHFVGERTEEYRRGSVRRWIAGHLQTARVESHGVDVHKGHTKYVHQSKRTLGKCTVQNDQIEMSI